MATQNLQAADAILKDLYVGPIVEQLNQKTYLLDQLDRDTDHIDHTGRRAVVPVHMNRNRGRRSMTEAAPTLPQAGKQKWQDAIIKIRYHAFGIELTDGSIQATTSNEGAFISLMEAESKGVAQDMKKEMCRQAYGDGSALLATAVSATGAGAAGTLVVDSVQYIHIDDPIDVLVKATGATTAGVQRAVVTGRNVATNTLNIAPAVTTAASVNNTYGVYVSGSYGNEMDGLVNLTGDTGIVHQIDRSVAGNEFFKGNVLPAGGVAGESLFEQLYDRCGENGQDIDVFLTTRGIRRRLSDEFAAQRRLTDANMVTIRGGYRSIAVNDRPVLSDDDAPKGRVFAINRSVLKWFEQTKPGWLESPKDGAIFQLKHTANAGEREAIWQAWFRWYVALGIVRPNVTGQLTGCQDDGANDNE